MLSWITNITRIQVTLLILGFHFFAVSAVSAQQGIVAPQAAQQLPIIRQITVSGNERVEQETIASYLTVREGDVFDPDAIDLSIKRLYGTGLFSDVTMFEQNGVLIIRVVENPIINRVIYEGNKKLDREDFNEEVRLRPRQVFTRAKVRADVQRMLELYRRSGRFAAIIEPKVVQQEQNRVDVVFEIQEGPKSKVSRINFIGNKIYSDGDLRDVLATKESRWWKFFTSNDTFDPDRLAYDQQVLREFYLNEGYADFRTISAVSELTPDREDFFITFSIEEGEIYEFGKIEVVSEIRDIDSDFLRAFVGLREGQTYNAERIEQSIESLTNTAGLLGYAFVDVRREIQKNRDERTIDITFRLLDAPRVYVERINIGGNVRTLDRVIRREFRLQEGDAFNSALVMRSESLLERLNFFREVEIEQLPGSTPDRIVLDVNVEEQATGQLNVGAGFSSLENFIFNASIQQNNLLGKGQTLRLGLSLSGFRQEIDVGFTEPYFGGRRVSAGADVFLRRLDATFNSSDNGTIQDQIGFSLRLGAAIGDFWTLSTRYTLRHDDVQLGSNRLAFLAAQEVARQARLVELAATDEERAELLALFDLNNDGMVSDLDLDTDGDGAVSEQEQIDGLPPRTSDSIGKRVQSILGYTLGYDTRNSFIRPTRGTGFFLSQDFAGVGGDVTYLRTRLNLDHYWTPFAGWTLRFSGEGGYIKGIGERVRINDRFFLGGPRLRGFDTSGVGPRDLSFNLEQGRAEGGRAFYVGRAELFFPLGDLALESGVRASAFIDAGSLFDAQNDSASLPNCQFSATELQAVINGEADVADLPGGRFCIGGNSASPRIAAGVGVSWQSPFGPFRIDLARIIRSQAGDQTQTLQFNVGTTF